MVISRHDGGNHCIPFDPVSVIAGGRASEAHFTSRTILSVKYQKNASDQDDHFYILYDMDSVS